MNFKLIFSFIIISSLVYSQDSLSTDYKNYKEDQFYFSVTYNFLANKPDKASQNGFSPGFHFGFIKDMPINKTRDIALGLGLGYSYNLYNDNVFYSEDLNGSQTYQLITKDLGDVSRNRFITHSIELPFEFRWRTSTPETYKFWRIYAGIKASYIFAHSNVFKGDLGNFKYTDNSNVNDFQYGLTLSFGYNTWNFHVYYALNTIYNSEAQIGTEPVRMKPLKLGLIFYIL